MTALKVWDGSAWTTVSAGAPGPAGQPRVGALLAVQRQWGREEAWLAGPVNGAVVRCNASGSEVMRLTYTPTVVCWWDVSANLGLIYKTDGAYNYHQPALVLSLVDADGQYVSYQYEMQHSGVQTYAFSQLQRTWKLNPGNTYVCNLIWNVSGGTWQHYMGPGQLHMEGRVFSR